MARKFYAVREGRNPGIYESWELCRQQVEGYSSARYKSFPTREEAEAFLAGHSAAGIDKTSGETNLNHSGENAATAYVDGSYRPDTREYSCGAVLFYRGEELHFSEKFSDPELADMRNVAGEIMGATAVIRYCLEKNIPQLVIFHDYEGVARWAEGDWKTNRQGTKEYAAFCREARERLSLSFVKVRGHSGDRYNDLADRLAKEALGLAEGD